MDLSLDTLEVSLLVLSSASVHSEVLHVPAGQVLVDTFLRKMNGGSQSCLVGSSDNRFYVLKLANNPQGPNVLFNEALGALLANYLELPIPAWRPLYLEEDFIRQNRDLWFEFPGRRTVPPKPGLHFGSRVVARSDHQEIYEIVPSRWMERIRNPELLVGVLLFDIWTENIDRRQMLFIERPESRSLDLLFFDHGHLFRGPYGQRVLKSPEACLYYQQNSYKGAFELGNYENWLNRIEAISLKMLKNMIECVPSDWQEEQHVRNTIELLMQNRGAVREKMRRMAQKFC